MNRFLIEINDGYHTQMELHSKTMQYDEVFFKKIINLDEARVSIYFGCLLKINYLNFPDIILQITHAAFILILYNIGISIHLSNSTLKKPNVCQRRYFLENEN